MMRFLLFIKHRLTFLWSTAEWANGILFGLLFGNRLSAAVGKACSKYSREDITFRPVARNDIPALSAFFHAQPQETYLYFKPHEFDEKALLKLWKNPAFCQMIATTEEGQIVGYFMIRFFVNRKAFAGFLVGNQFQGHGIAKTMCRIVFDICWTNRFRTFATVSKQNGKALSAYRSINDFKILKELPNDYLYIEYVPVGQK